MLNKDDLVSLVDLVEKKIKITRDIAYQLPTIDMSNTYRKVSEPKLIKLERLKIKILDMIDSYDV